MTDAQRAGRRIHIQGIVQGVGFRPFVYGLAVRHGLGGWVLNNSSGVDIEVYGLPAVLDAFVAALSSEKPPLAVIDSLDVAPVPAPPQDGENDAPAFVIRHSVDQPAAFVPVSPDVTVCDDCLAELFDPHDRRYRYPFINCTNCGPRFTIIRDIPYDRPMTTMAPFAMCSDCQAEYEDPADRRRHAQQRLSGVRACVDAAGFAARQAAALDLAAPLSGDDALRQAQRCSTTGASSPSRALAAITSPAARSMTQPY